MKSKVIVITGSIATGKSLVSSYLKENGYMLLDADKIAHDLMRAGQKNYNNIVEYFGEEILDSNKNIDNKKLANIVFNDDKELQVLNNLTHDNIFNKIMNGIDNSNEDVNNCQIQYARAIRHGFDLNLGLLLFVYCSLQLLICGLFLILFSHLLD